MSRDKVAMYLFSTVVLFQWDKMLQSPKKAKQLPNTAFLHLTQKASRKNDQNFFWVFGDYFKKKPIQNKRPVLIGYILEKNRNSKGKKKWL